MAAILCTAAVHAQSDYESVIVRAAPSTNAQRIGALLVGAKGLKVLEVQADASEKQPDGKFIQWFRLELPGGKTGWVRDDLLDIQGECGGALGYGTLERPIHAVLLTRTERRTVFNEQERIRRAAFNITAAFEGSGYAAFQNLDAGIISYGRFQFTLNSGSLFSVVDKYLETAAGDTARLLKTLYLQRIKDRDAALRQDAQLQLLLVKAADEPEMRAAQDAVATELYWGRAQSVSIRPRNIRTALGQAFIFDTAINHGIMHDMISSAEQALGVAIKSRLPDNGTTEEKLIAQVAEIRRGRLTRLAENLGLPGLKTRGEFWTSLVQRGDWDLEGDANGNIAIRRGEIVQVRDP